MKEKTINFVHYTGKDNKPISGHLSTNFRDSQ